MNADNAWQRLVEAARRAPPARESAAPFGFATRVAARAMTQGPAGSLLERLSLRAMGLACVLAALALAANYRVVERRFSDDAPSDDPVAELVGIAS